MTGWQRIQELAGDQLLIDPWRIPVVMVSAIGIYVAFIVFVKVFGSRILTSTTSFDVVTTIMFGAVAGRVILGHPPTLAAGVIGLFTLGACEAVFGAVRQWRGFHVALSASPVVVVAHGELIEANLRRTHVTSSDVMSTLRRKGIGRLHRVQAVILEPTGDFSVIMQGEPIDPQILMRVSDAQLILRREQLTFPDGDSTHPQIPAAPEPEKEDER